MKNRITVKRTMAATKPAQAVRVIVLTDTRSERIGAHGPPRLQLRLREFRNHRFTPEIQVRQLPAPKAANLGSATARQQLLENRQRHRAVWFR
jgi:hypothetical protein